MEKIKKIITPLFLLFIWTFTTGMIVLTKDTGEEGWGYIVAIIICLFSIGPLLIDYLMKKVIKDRKKNILMQIPITIIITFLYWKWDLIGIL